MNPIALEYVWVDGSQGLRSKWKTLYDISVNDLSLATIPLWNYDGSSTGQATTENSEIILYPVKWVLHPAPIGTCPSFIVLCKTTTREKCADLCAEHAKLAPWFGIEQEYFIINDKDQPKAFDSGIPPRPQGPYYCGLGLPLRSVAEMHYEWCIKAGLRISGINAEVAPSQWEFQIGPCEGVDAGDQLWIARFLLHRVAEAFSCKITFAPKPLPHPWNGSGLHTNVSTCDTRNEEGLAVIQDYMKKLQPRHADHLAVYGDNSERLSGQCETSRKEEFTVGYGNRGCSIRIPYSVLKDKKGYFEDRRPASDADPYEVIHVIMETICQK